MNESILEALMRLFAIVSDVDSDGNSDNERDIITDYLDRQYSAELVQTYLEFFDEQVKRYHPYHMYTNDVETHKQNTANEADIIELCNQINAELVLEQKMIVLIYLFDFINRGDALTDNELKFVTSVAAHLKLEASDFQDVKAFTFGEFSLTLIFGNMLLPLRFRHAVVFTCLAFAMTSAAILTKPDLDATLRFAFAVQLATGELSITACSRSPRNL